MLTLYYRKDCHLCELMLAELRELYGDKLQLNLVDIDTDAQLRASYGTQVPVLMGDGTILGTGKLDRSSLEDYLQAH